MTIRSTSGSSLSLCQTTAGFCPEMSVNAATMSRSRLRPGKTMTADFMRRLVVSRRPDCKDYPTATTVMPRSPGLIGGELWQQLAWWTLRRSDRNGHRGVGGEHHADREEEQHGERKGLDHGGRLTGLRRAIRGAKTGYRREELRGIQSVWLSRR